MVTVIISTTNRPQMLRTALRSVQRQTARQQIDEIVVSENGGCADSSTLLDEFPDLPIKYIYRDPPLPPLLHGVELFSRPEATRARYIAILHDDDWWGAHHLADGLAALEQHPDAPAYWSTSFLVNGEASWFHQCWNESCWVAAGFPPTAEVVRLDSRQAALACLGSGAAHFSTLIARKEALGESFRAVADTGNLHDSDRLLFIELSRRGPLLMNFVPQVFIRQHPAQDQRQLSFRQSSDHVAAATRLVLDYCRELGLNINEEFTKLYEECPLETYRAYMLGTFDPRATSELRRIGALPLPHLLQRTRGPKWLLYQICPHGVWAAARVVKNAMRKRASGYSAAS